MIYTQKTFKQLKERVFKNPKQRAYDIATTLANKLIVKIKSI